MDGFRLIINLRESSGYSFNGGAYFVGYVTHLISPWFLWFMQRDLLIDEMVGTAICFAINIVGMMTIM